MKKRKISKTGKIIIGIMILILTISVTCLLLPSKKVNNIHKIDKKQETIEEKPKEIKEEKKLQIIDLESNTRPYAVMINNISNVWGYQSGLQDAYLIYEIIVEGGYTRLMALFKDKN